MCETLHLSLGNKQQQTTNPGTLKKRSSALLESLSSDDDEDDKHVAVTNNFLGNHDLELQNKQELKTGTTTITTTKKDFIPTGNYSAVQDALDEMSINSTQTHAS